MMRSGAARRRMIGAAAAAVGIALAAFPIPSSAPAAGDDEAWTGMAGVDTSLPLTDSAVAVQGRGAFADMSITVNQTENLTNQAVSITWSGAPPTVSAGPRTFHANFVQVMQCWGEPDASVLENPGPPPEQCVWGALNPTASSEQKGFATHLVTSRAFSNTEWPDFDPGVGTVDESGDVYRDFVAVDGTVVTDHVDHTATGTFEQYWLNTYFDSVKTNELPGVRTLRDGTGQALFTVNTGVESSGLGCGQRVQPSSGGEPTIPRCWLVIVPRGTPEAENVGSPFSPTEGVATSPMNPTSWHNRIAIELHFTPIDSPCELASEQRLINGTELVLGAVTSWQPALCSNPELLPYAYGVGGDGVARQQLLSGAPGAPGMVVVNRPIPVDTVLPEEPVVYAPLTASAVAIGFNVERVAVLGGTDDRRLQSVRVADINLTPRLVAKLLTQSYRSQVEIQGSEPYEWDDENPLHMLADPDFLQFNPEFTLWQSGSGKHAGGLLLPQGTSDLASQVWDWILADPEAVAWLAGEPDEWGMVVNPVYATTAERNSTGFPFADTPPDSFPKTDPYCYQAPPLQSGVVPPQLCALDWFPYASGFGDAARLTAAASDGARTLLDLFAGTANDAWGRSGPQTVGRRTIFGLTDLPSLTRFGLQAARLSQAGDNGPDREFIAPTEEAVERGVRSMTPEAGMLQLDASDLDDGAYPLTTLAYAAIRPLELTEADREGYAAFLDYAAGPGQEPGFDLGQLPPGYLPLPTELARATAAAAEKVRTLEAPVTTTTTESTTTTVASPTTSAPPATVPPAQGSGSGSGFTSAAALSSNTGGDDGTEPVTPPTVAITDVAAPTLEPPSSRGVTPVSALGGIRFAVTVVAVIALLSFLGVLEITKRPRQAVGVPTPSPKPRP